MLYYSMNENIDPSILKNTVQNIQYTYFTFPHT